MLGWKTFCFALFIRRTFWWPNLIFLVLFLDICIVFEFDCFLVKITIFSLLRVLLCISINLRATIVVLHILGHEFIKVNVLIIFYSLFYLFLFFRRFILVFLLILHDLTSYRVISRVFVSIIFNFYSFADVNFRSFSFLWLVLFWTVSTLLFGLHFNFFFLFTDDLIIRILFLVCINYSYEVLIFLFFAIRLKSLIYIGPFTCLRLLLLCSYSIH